MKAFKVRRNGQNYFRVDLPKELFTDGKRHSVMAQTRREALAKADDVIEKRKNGLDVESAKASLTDFLSRFLDYYKTEGGVALRTWQDYRYHIEKNITPVIGGIAVGELKPRDVDQWLKVLRERGLGDRTVEYAQSVLRRALQFALEWEMIARNPAGARFRAAKRKRSVKSGAKIRFLNPDEARAFLKAIEGDRHEALYALALTTGLRPEELYGLRWKDVALDRRRLTVNQVIAQSRRKKGEAGERFQFGPPKNDLSGRTIDFAPFIQKNDVQDLERLADAHWMDNELVFPSEIGTPLDERNVLRRFQAICQSNGLPELRLYDLRHSHASLLINEGVTPRRLRSVLAMPKSR